VRCLAAAELGGATLFWGLALAGCTRFVTVDRLPQAYYQTATPSQDVSGALEVAMRAVKRIRVTGAYDNYRFAPGDQPMEGDPLTPEVLARATDTFSSSTSREASAVQIARAGLKVTLLTNQHPIQIPDTIVEYQETPEGSASTGPRPIESVSVLRSRYNMVADSLSVLRFEVLAEDAQADLALLGTVYPADTPPRALSTLRVPMGNSERLSWGSFVYVLGHPGGYDMVTQGIVSDPGRGPSSFFIIDGLWNEGMSGGPILAFRGEDETLEWVGIARAAAGRTEQRLVPDPDFIPEREERTLYRGRIYIEEVQRILYGISFSVPTAAIRRFTNRSRPRLRARGWPLPDD
jgi:S1-C subfamily serine protease